MDLSLRGWIHALIFAAGLGVAIRIARLLLLRIWGITTEAREAGIALGIVVGIMIATGLTRDLVTASVVGAGTVIVYIVTKILRHKR